MYVHRECMFVCTEWIQVYSNSLKLHGLLWSTAAHKTAHFESEKNTQVKLHIGEKIMAY